MRRQERQRKGESKGRTEVAAREKWGGSGKNIHRESDVYLDIFTWAEKMKKKRFFVEVTVSQK